MSRNLLKFLSYTSSVFHPSPNKFKPLDEKIPSLLRERPTSNHVRRPDPQRGSSLEDSRSGPRDWTPIRGNRLRWETEGSREGSRYFSVLPRDPPPSLVSGVSHRRPVQLSIFVSTPGPLSVEQEYDFSGKKSPVTFNSTLFLRSRPNKKRPFIYEGGKETGLMTGVRWSPIDRKTSSPSVPSST